LESKIILISDLHGQEKALVYLQKIIEKENPQALICSGDITHFGDISYLNKFFKLLESNGLTGFLIWGNSDSQDVQQSIIKSPYNSHLKVRNFMGLKIYGVGLVEEPPKINPADVKDSILITHRPPVKKLIEKNYENAPAYHISGHLHYSKWVKKYPSTVHIQVPSLQTGEYATLLIPSHKVEFESIL